MYVLCLCDHVICIIYRIYLSYCDAAGQVSSMKIMSSDLHHFEASLYICYIDRSQGKGDSFSQSKERVLGPVLKHFDVIQFFRCQAIHGATHTGMIMNQSMRLKILQLIFP